MMRLIIAQRSVRITAQLDIREAVDETLSALNDGQIRVAEKLNGQWHVK